MPKKINPLARAKKAKPAPAKKSVTVIVKKNNSSKKGMC